MTEQQKANRLRKAKQIIERCRVADVEPPRWVKVLLGFEPKAKGVSK